MKKMILAVLIALTAVPAFAHEVEPLPMKEACDAAKWLGASLSKAPLESAMYLAIDALASDAFDECEAYQETAIDWTEKERLMGEAINAAYERANKTVTKCD